MTIFQTRIEMGLEDTRLEEHIRMLEAHKSGASGSAGISVGEQVILDLLYKRLDEITKPTGEQITPDLLKRLVKP